MENCELILNHVWVCYFDEAFVHWCCFLADEACWNWRKNALRCLRIVHIFKTLRSYNAGSETEISLTTRHPGGAC